MKIKNYRVKKLEKILKPKDRINLQWELICKNGKKVKLKGLSEAEELELIKNGGWSLL